MGEKICRHCGATVLVGLQYCPSCLRSIRGKANRGGKGAAVATASDVNATRIEWLQARWEDFVSFFTPGAAAAVEKDDPRFAYNKPGTVATMAMSEGYTRVVCPSCLRPHRAPLDQSPSARVMCNVCMHQFPASLAAEFRRGADLNCFHCGVTTFCVDGSKVHECPNCKMHVNRTIDPERTKLMTFAGVVGLLILAGFGHAVATQTTPQFLLWLCVGSVFTFFGFIALVALGF